MPGHRYGVPPSYGPPPSYGYPRADSYLYGVPSPRPKVMASPGKVIAGVVLSVVGSVGILFGAGLMGSATENVEYVCDPGAPVCTPHDRTDRLAVGIGFLVAGVAATAVGIPLIVIGSKKVPAQTKEKEEARFTPTLRVGLTQATFSVHF